MFFSGCWEQPLIYLKTTLQSFVTEYFKLLLISHHLVLSNFWGSFDLYFGYFWLCWKVELQKVFGLISSHFWRFWPTYSVLLACGEKLDVGAFLAPSFRRSHQCRGFFHIFFKLFGFLVFLRRLVLGMYWKAWFKSPSGFIQRILRE